MMRYPGQAGDLQDAPTPTVNETLPEPAVMPHDAARGPPPLQQQSAKGQPHRLHPDEASNHALTNHHQALAVRP